MRRCIAAAFLVSTAADAQVTDQDINRALDRAATAISFSSRMYIDCATKAVVTVDDGATDAAIVADALRYRCLESFQAGTPDIPELMKASALANLQPTLVEIVNTSRRKAGNKQKLPKPKPAM